MIHHAKTMRSEARSNMRGGNGTISLSHLMEGGDTFGKSRLIAKLSLPPGASIGVHDHNPDAELYIIIAGVATVTDNGVESTMEPGDAMFTGNGGTHSIANLSSSELVIYAVIFN